MNTAHLALLRAINVGGNNRLPMADLKTMFTAAGCTGVRNYIQSGNILFSAPASLCPKLPGLIADQVFRNFQHRPPILLRTREQLAQIIATNPFLKSSVPLDNLHIAFLSTTPTATQIASLDPARSIPDLLTVHNQEIYLHLPNGAGQSKLTNQYFDSKLQTVSTVRNWRTVLKFEMMHQTK